MSLAPPTEPLRVPARRLEPSPGRDRRLRRVTTAVGAVIVLLVVLALAGLTTATWMAGRGYSPIPAVTALGSPAALELTSGTGAVRVLPSGEVDELTLALVAPGTTSLPATADRVPATLTRSGDGGTARVEVRQPVRSFSPPWADATRDVLLLVPTGLELDLEVRTDMGDVLVDGELASVVAHSDSGDLRLGLLSAPGGVSASADVGDVEVELAAPAPATVDLAAGVGDVDLLLPTDADGRVTITAELGDVDVAAPGTTRWRVRADSGLGDVHVAPGLRASAGEAAGTLTVTTGAGTVSLTR